MDEGIGFVLENHLVDDGADFAKAPGGFDELGEGFGFHEAVGFALGAEVGFEFAKRRLLFGIEG